MCGIVGVVGQQDAAPRLLEALRRLEYRGYDSAGIATLVNGHIDRRRAEGKLVNLAHVLEREPLEGRTGIGHTRWATHGAPTERNAHPHGTKRVSVVHNGIIENHAELRAELEAQGAIFETETDTETFARLLDRNLAEGQGPEEAFSNALKRVRGAFALAAADGEPAACALCSDAHEAFGANDAWQLAALERRYQQRQARSLCSAGVRLADPQRFDLRGGVTVGQDVEIDVDVILEGNVQLGDAVSIGPFSRIKDSTLAPGTRVLAHCDLDGVVTHGACVIGPYARLRPGTELAAGVHIGNFVETKKTVLGAGSKANHLTYLGDAVVGAGVNIGAGTITCNYDGVNKSVTRIGDDAFIGSNSALVAPVSIGAGATIGAGSVITRDAPEQELTVARARQLSLPGWKRPQKKS